MKTKNWILTVLAFLVAAIGTASDFPRMNVVPVEKDKALVVFTSTSATPLEITLSNWKGDIVYFKKTKERFDNYEEVFDFSEMGKGKYGVCINFGNRSINRSVEVGKEGIKVGTALRCYEPCFRMKDKMLSVSFFNCPCEPVYVNIYHRGKHISAVNLGKELTVQRYMDLSQLRKGEYEIVLTDRFKEHRYIAQL